MHCENLILLWTAEDRELHRIEDQITEYYSQRSMENVNNTQSVYDWGQTWNSRIKSMNYKHYRVQELNVRNTMRKRKTG